MLEKKMEIAFWVRSSKAVLAAYCQYKPLFSSTRSYLCKSHTFPGDREDKDYLWLCAEVWQSQVKKQHLNPIYVYLAPSPTRFYWSHTQADSSTLHLRAGVNMVKYRVIYFSPILCFNGQEEDRVLTTANFGKTDQNLWIPEIDDRFSSQTAENC